MRVDVELPKEKSKETVLQTKSMHIFQFQSDYVSCLEFSSVVIDVIFNSQRAINILIPKYLRNGLRLLLTTYVKQSSLGLRQLSKQRRLTIEVGNL